MSLENLGPIFTSYLPKKKKKITVMNSSYTLCIPQQAYLKVRPNQNLPFVEFQIFCKLIKSMVNIKDRKSFQQAKRNLTHI